MKLLSFCYFALLALSLGYSSVLLLADFYSPTLFLIKSFAFQASISLLFMNSLVAFLVPRKKYILPATLSVNVLLCLVIGSQYSFHNRSAETTQQFKLTSFSSMTRTRNGQDIIDYLNAEKPEVLCLQEVTFEDTKQLHEHYQYIYQPGNDDLVLASVWPIQPIQTSQGSQRANIQSPYGDIEITNVHMPRQYGTKGIDASWRQLITKLGNNDSAAILCGDFNMTPYNSMYAKITTELAYDDAHTQSQGFNFTFPHKQRRIALFGVQFRIDYVFTKGLKVTGSKTFGLSDLSDHRAIRVTIIKPEEGPSN